MESTSQIRYHGMAASPALTQCVRSKVAKLRRLNPDIVGWAVHIDLPHKHSEGGRAIEVGVEVVLPGRTLAVSHVANEDAYVAVRLAFERMAGQLGSVAGRGRARRHDAGNPAPRQIGGDGGG